MDEKDRLREKLRDKEKAEEDRWIEEREKALLAKLRAGGSPAPEQETPDVAPMRCPRCGEGLATRHHQGATAEECAGCGGMWLDVKELEKIAHRERDSWLGRVFFRPKA